jgi:hypothetical protein
LLIKIATASILVQAFIHPSHSRYWIGFAPLMALAVGSVCVVLSRSRCRRATAQFDPLDRTARLMTALQAAYAAMATVLTAILLIY